MSLLGAVPTGGLWAPSLRPAEGGAAGGGDAGRGWAGGRREAPGATGGHWRLCAFQLEPRCLEAVWLALPEDGDSAVTTQGFLQMLTPAPSKIAKAPGKPRSRGKWQGGNWILFAHV